MFRESLSFLPFDSEISLLWVEAALWLALVVLAFLLSRTQFRLQARWWNLFSNRRALSLIAIAVLAIALRLALVPWMPVPTPTIHDEFSYLLASDTFAHGRLTNPPHPLGIHFESVHINVRPTYQSMYPPAQGLALALGQVIFGSPWLGVLLSAAAVSMAVTWMLQGWMPSRWALLGGMFCVLRYATFSYTINSYMGGAVAGIGGALVLGAAGRMRRNIHPRDALLFASGLALLANSRPYEGAMLAVPALLIPAWRKMQWKALFPALMLLVAIGAWMLYYNWRGTENPLLMPYQANWEQYHITRPFIWQKARAIPQYAHASLRWVYVSWELPVYLQTRTAEGLLKWTIEKLALYYRFYIFPLLPLLVLGVRYALRSRNKRLLGIAVFWMLGALLVLAWRPQPHYASPAIALVIAIVLLGLRALRTHGTFGRTLASLVIAMTCALMLWQIAVRVASPYDLRYRYKLEVERPRVIHQLERMGGKHVILVHYVVGHEPAEEWVYNSADIDAQQVIWARDMGEARNQELIEYYRDRKIWVMQPDSANAFLVPLSK